MDLHVLGLAAYAWMYGSTCLFWSQPIIAVGMASGRAEIELERLTPTHRLESYLISPLHFIVGSIKTEKDHTYLRNLLGFNSLSSL